jgi:hypothetical protein
MNLRTGVAAALCLAATLLFSYSAAAYVATNNSISVSLWRFCVGIRCEEVNSGNCNDANDAIRANRAAVIVAAMFAGFAAIGLAADLFWPNVLPRFVNPTLALVGGIFGVVSFSIGFAIFSRAFCSGGSLETNGYTLGASAPVGVVGTAFVAAGFLVEVCCAASPGAEEAAAAATAADLARAGLAPTALSVPSRPRTAPPSGAAPSAAAAARETAKQSAPLAPMAVAQFAAAPFPLSGGSASSRSSSASATAAAYAAQAPTGGDWAFDQVAGMLWSQEHQLFYNQRTQLFVDPVTNQTYDPVTRRWSG